MHPEKHYPRTGDRETVYLKPGHYKSQHSGG